MIFREVKTRNPDYYNTQHNNVPLQMTCGGTDFTALSNFFYSWGFYQTNGKESDIDEYCYNNDLQDYFNAWQADNKLIEYSFSHASFSYSSVSSASARWSNDEINLLGALKKRDLTYAEISREFQTQLGVQRTPIQIQQRWERIQRPGIRKGRFSKDEDLQILCALKAGESDFHRLSEVLPRTLYQIKRRAAVLQKLQRTK